MKIIKAAKSVQRTNAKKLLQKPHARVVRKGFVGGKGVGAQVSRPFKTIGDYMQWAIRCFNKSGLHFGHGTDNAHDEAVYLILATLNLPLDSSRAVLKRKVTAEDGRRVTAVIEQRLCERKPAAYLTHKAYFAGLEFYVDERVLIPRSPVAELIERQFAPWIEAGRVRRILDIGTGSGCIAIACARAFPRVIVDAVDISTEALEVATINVKKHGMGRWVNLIKSDLFAGLAGTDRRGYRGAVLAPLVGDDRGNDLREGADVHGAVSAGASRYDIIISNPPYVSASEMRTLPPEYKHEPNMALEAGDKGLQIVERLLCEAGKYLSPQGIVIVEVGNSAAALIKVYPHIPFVWLEFARGDSEVFLLDAAEVRKFFGRGARQRQSAGKHGRC